MDIIGDYKINPQKGIWGWTISKNDLKPVEVFLYINDEIVGTQKAEMLRPPIVEKGLHPTGNCGFRFIFSDLDIKPAPHYEISVKAGLSQVPIGQKMITTALGLPPFSHFPTEQNFFIHIQKTAGTSFRAMLRDIFQPKDVFIDPVVQGRYPRYDQYLKHARETKNPPSLWVGHVPFITGKYLSPHLRYLTFLREPLSRAISHLRYLKQTRDGFQDMTLNEVFDEIRETELNNLQARFFADSDINYLAYYGGAKAMDDDGLSMAKANLDQCFFIGITEQFSSSVSMLEKLVSWNFKSNLHINSTKAKRHNDVTPYILKNIYPCIEYDLKLYEWGVKRFNERKQDLIS